MELGRGSSSKSRERNKEIKPKSQLNYVRNIPEEIIIEILSRLPNDSLFRFRCVSKKWYSLISDSKLPGKRQKVIVLSQLVDGSFSFHSIDQQCSMEKVQAPWDKKLHLYPHPHEVKIYGSCNGLFLLGLKVDLYLWNPLNGYFNKVLSSHRSMLPYPITASGLCYDSSTNGYKAVMVFGKSVMVVYLRRKCWKEVRFPYNIDTVRSGPVVNGRLHWFACEITNFVSTHCIFSFDPRVDEFEKVPLPNLPKDGDGNTWLGLGVLGECLSITRLHQRHQGNAEVWVMKEYGVKKSWNLVFVTSSTFMVYSELVPLCCTEDGKVLMREHVGYDSRDISVYNSNGGLDGYLPSPCNCKYSREAIEYVESSVKPTRYNWKKEERRGIAKYVEQFLSASPQKMIKGKGNNKWDYLDPKEAAAKGTRKKRSLKRNRR